MLMQCMVPSLTVLLLILSVVSGDDLRASGIAAAQPKQRSLAERIAFACEHKPSLSFCASSTSEPTTTITPLTDSVSPDGFPLQSKRRSDSPTPKRRVRWVFVPHSDDGRFWDELSKSARSPALEPERKKEEPKEPRESKEPLLIVPPEPYAEKRGSSPTRALQSRTFPVLPSDAAYGAGQVHAVDGDPFSAFNSLTDEKGLAHRPRSRSPFTKPGLWEPNPDDPHSRDPANKWWYKPESLQWGGHWAVPAAGVGGTNGQSALHFPSIGTFLGIPDDYD